MEYNAEAEYCSRFEINGVFYTPECFNDWGGRGYADFVPEEVTKTTPSGDRTT